MLSTHPARPGIRDLWESLSTTELWLFFYTLWCVWGDLGRAFLVWLLLLYLWSSH